MKTRSLLLSLLVMLATLGYGQSKAEKKAEKAAKKEAKLVEQAMRMEPLNELIRNKTWVLEGNQLKADKGRMATNLNSNLNFVSCVGEDGTVQLSFNGIPGWNGVGGVTLDGKYDSYNVSEPKKKGQGVTLQANVRGTGGFARMTLLIQSPTQVEVRISGNWGQQITLYGSIYSPDDSRVFKGMRNN
jgi:hypothetical protein